MDRFVRRTKMMSVFCRGKYILESFRSAVTAAVFIDFHCSALADKTTGSVQFAVTKICRFFRESDPENVAVIFINVGIIYLFQL